ESHRSSREAIRARYFPDVVLTTHEGKKVCFYDDLIKDKIVVLNFMFTKCDDICPLVTANLEQVQPLLGDRMGQDIFFYSITLKPEEDTPEVLAAHAEAFNVKPGWLFLTGAQSDIELLRRKLGFVDPNPALDSKAETHSGFLRYGNEARELWGGCAAMSKPEFLAEVISWVDWEENKRKQLLNGTAHIHGGAPTNSPPPSPPARQQPEGAAHHHG